MPEILSLQGRAALSPFRIAKLLAGLCAARANHGIVAIEATFRHFVEVERPLSPGERDVLERLLTYGRRSPSAGGGGELLLVVPRPGTISPWSSKATDIARNCGLAAVRRIERGVDFRVRARGGEAVAAD